MTHGRVALHSALGGRARRRSGWALNTLRLCAKSKSRRWQRMQLLTEEHSESALAHPRTEDRERLLERVRGAYRRRYRFLEVVPASPREVVVSEFTLLDGVIVGPDKDQRLNELSVAPIRITITATIGVERLVSRESRDLSTIEA